MLGAVDEAKAAIFYVNANALAGGNGSSWTKAFNNLDLALIAAGAQNSFNQIWIAKGTYKPTIPYAGGYEGREANLVTFKLPNNIAIYGGFAGNESLLSQRKTDENATILSGDILGDDVNIPNYFINKSDNAWHVVTADGATSVILDNLTIQNGYAAGPDSGIVSAKNPISMRIIAIDYAHDTGGGLFVRHGAKVTLNNVKFSYNVANSSRATMFMTPGDAPIAAGGGAVVVMDPKTLVTINNSIFSNNSAYSPPPFFGSSGGALNALLDGAFAISNSQFIYNQAERAGGAIQLKNSADTTINSSIFTANTVVGNFTGDERGGAISSFDASLTISDSTFNANLVNTSLFGSGGAISQQVPPDHGIAPKLKISNSTFSNNKASTFGGGAIFIFGSKVNPAVIAKITNSVFTSNVAGAGGGLYVDSLPTSVQNCGFTDNQAWLVGGGVLAANFADAINDITALTTRSRLDISNSVFSGNLIIGVPLYKHSPHYILSKYAQSTAADLGLNPANVLQLSTGGAAVASILGANVNILNSAFTLNIAYIGNGGALLIGGTQGFAGTTKLAMNQSYVNLSTSTCVSNIAPYGYWNHTSLIDLAHIGSDSNGVQFVTDGSCPLVATFKSGNPDIEEKIKDLIKLRKQSIKEEHLKRKDAL